MFNDAVILVTGGTGSFGNAFVSLILKNYKPKKLIVFSRDEMKQWEMAKKFENSCVRFLLEMYAIRIECTEHSQE